MKTPTRHVALIALVAFVAGCGSVVSRLGADGRSDLYPATSATLEIAGDPLCWLFFACPVFLASLPVDAALDTLLLPVDTVRMLNHEASEKKAEARETPEPPGVIEPS